MALTLTRCPHPLVEQVYASRQLPLESGAFAPLNVYIPREQGDYLYALVRHYRPRVTVEVGMANGLSTLFIAAALRDNGGDGRHVAIDGISSNQTPPWAPPAAASFFASGLTTVETVRIRWSTARFSQDRRAG